MALKSRLEKAVRPESRLALISATAQLLSEKSIPDTSLSEIAVRSGLNSALIKYYFGSKEGLFMAVLERDAEASMEALSELVDMPISAEQKLKIHIKGIINTYYRSPYINRLINYMIVQGQPASAQRVAEIFVEPMIDAYRRIVSQGVDEGRFRSVDPGMLYYSTVGACEHIFYASYSIPTTLGIERLTEETKQAYAQHVIDLCFGGILAKP
ncbi:MAG: TetR family transcriptional regulator [Candidatus Brevundimonas colombiensis]|uniref:TetR family transcriptional regulator n=1 Tax=Candidatus Brevundimonas colombiensis TaxID=3121376 RepID=A0AAJ5WXP4_9CAUL|nr:TetR family transcriptional regulator [Brevundimonas sp.]WEK38468.1 MAG: TetR family transcriptional regulator [Brevundimonas sp.]